MGRCPCSDEIRISPVQPWRRVGLVTAWDGADRWWNHDVVLCQLSPPVKRFGRCYVVCACEPGHVRLGGSVAAIWGSDADLRAEYAAAAAPVTIAGLYPGEEPGPGLEAVRAIASERGHVVVALRFGSWATVETSRGLVTSWGASDPL